MDGNIREDISVADYFRSEYNQSYFKEISLGVIGEGKIFGVSDAWLNRKNIYTLKTKTPEAKVFMLNASEFRRWLEDIQNEKKKFDFTKICKEIDEMRAN